MPGLSVANRLEVKRDHPRRIVVEAWRGEDYAFGMDDDDGVMVDGYLDELLTKAGLTRPQLAALSGVSYSHVANVANGTKPLTTKVGLKIAKALGLELAELMARKPAVPDASGTVDALGIVSMHVW